MTRFRALTQLVLARMREFFREPATIFWVYGFPLMLAGILGFAFAQSEPTPPDVDVVAGGRADEIAKVLADKGFKVQILPEAECDSRLRKAQSTLVILAPQSGPINYRYDEKRAESVAARNWADSVLVRSIAGMPAPQPELIKDRASKYISFLLPGLIGINIMGGGLFGIGFVLVDMRVRKLFKRLMATPMHRGDFLWSLIISRLIFLIPEMASLLILARLAFDVPMDGNWATLALVVLLGSLAFSGIGLLMGSRTDKTETISGLLNLVMLPMYLFGGVFFSSKRFPDMAQPFIQALPLTQLNDALREVMLEGAGLDKIAWRLVILAAWGAVTFLIALRIFKWT